MFRSIPKFLGQLFTNHGIMHLVLFIVSGIIITSLTILFTGNGLIVDAVDTFAEWEYVRMALSAGTWGATAIVILMGMYEKIKGAL